MYVYKWEAAKKVLFLMAVNKVPKKFFFLNGETFTPHPPPLLSLPLRKELFLFWAKKNGCYNIFQKNRAILVQKLWGEKKLSKSVFGCFKTKKKFNKKKHTFMHILPFQPPSYPSPIADRIKANAMRNFNQSPFHNFLPFSSVRTNWKRIGNCEADRRKLTCC